MYKWMHVYVIHSYICNVGNIVSLLPFFLLLKSEIYPKACRHLVTVACLYAAAKTGIITHTVRIMTFTIVTCNTIAEQYFIFATRRQMTGSGKVFNLL